MSFYNFKRIQVVPTSADFIDIVLSKTQRKTPTVVHPGYAIGRIRQFYMRKVKFSQDTFNEKLSQILGDFPKLDEIHPFYCDLMNILYDRDHYKLALGQINTARHLIDSVAKDYCRLLKFGDSLYRCQQLKKAALGRMATIMKRQRDSLAYLEQVRQHLARLPSIDPNTRTLLICGYPNVGKSSFMNKVTRAEVDVQPYAFTTKSLFVGHMDYKYLRWQVIDTPGILDHPLEQRNTIEMQSITALAHLRSVILFFLDISEQCGYTLASQLSLYESIKPLFANKPIVLVINKIDVRSLDDLAPEEAALIEAAKQDPNVTVLSMSCFSDVGVMGVRNEACDRLLQMRVEAKMKSAKVEDVLNKLHLAQPALRDDVARPPVIPAILATRTKYSKTDPNRRKLARDIEEEAGGAGVYNVELREDYLLKDPEWKFDKIPEIFEGKNVADFVDPDIESKLQALEEDEQRLIDQGYYESEEEIIDSDEEAIRAATKEVRNKKALIIQAHRSEQNKNRPSISKKAKMIRTGPVRTSAKDTDDMSIDDAEPNMRARSLARASRKRERSPSAMSVVSVTRRDHSAVRDRSVMGLRNKKQKTESETIMKQAQRPKNLMAKRGEADREIQVKNCKWLLAGKRGMGKTQRR